MEPGVAIPPSSPGASKDVVKRINLSCAEQGNIVLTTKHQERKSEPGFTGWVGWTGLFVNDEINGPDQFPQPRLDPSVAYR
jgi:hypothetical protein